MLFITHSHSPTHTVGTIFLDEPLAQSVLEEAGEVEICAVIGGGVTLDRDVMATIETTPLTATGNIASFVLYQSVSTVVSYSEPADYGGGVFNLTFVQPWIRECVNISIFLDNIFEEDESFEVAVFSDDPAIEPGSPTTVNVTIIDESGKSDNKWTPIISDICHLSTDIVFDFVNDVNGVYSVQESDGVATVCVELQKGVKDREVVLMLNTSQLTAIADSEPSHTHYFIHQFFIPSSSPSPSLSLSVVDYEPVDVDLIFNASRSIVCVDIELVQDFVIENTEEFIVILSTSDPDVVFVNNEASVLINDSTSEPL